jgi:hypothetical protein
VAILVPNQVGDLAIRLREELQLVIDDFKEELARRLRKDREFSLILRSGCRICIAGRRVRRLKVEARVKMAARGPPERQIAETRIPGEKAHMAVGQLSQSRVFARLRIGAIFAWGVLSSVPTFAVADTISGQVLG